MAAVPPIRTATAGFPARTAVATATVVTVVAAESCRKTVRSRSAVTRTTATVIAHLVQAVLCGVIRVVVGTAAGIGKRIQTGISPVAVTAAVATVIATAFTRKQVQNPVENSAAVTTATAVIEITHQYIVPLSLVAQKFSPLRL